MTAREKDRFQRLEALFQAALEQEPAGRDLWLEQQCAGDADLLDEVRRLLADDKRIAAQVQPETLPRFGAWQAVRLLGRGGMGVVYLASRADGSFHMDAAVKVVPLALASVEIEERFRRERQFLARLDHPRIARLIDGGMAETGLPYLVMEFVDGTSIDRYCDERGLNLRARIALVRQVLEPLIYIHARQVTHRDLKPSNILVDAAGNVKLLDFGTARLVDASGDSAITRSGVFAYTPECASPEQVMGRPVTVATDVYAAGVLLYRLLTGRRPYRLDDLSRAGIADVICHTPPDPPRLDPSLNAILQKALAKEPEERYASAAELDADLARFLGGEVVRVRRVIRPRPRALATVCVTLLLAAAWGIEWIGAQAQARQSYMISTVAGNGRLPFAGSGTPALHADLVLPQYVAADPAGNIFLTDVYYQQVFRIDATGTISVFAGTGKEGFSGDNGPAPAAQFSNPLGVAVDAAGNVFIMDNGNARLRKVAPDGVVTTVASVLGGSIAVDALENVYVSQTLVHQIHKVTPEGAVTTVPGIEEAGLAKPGGLRFDAAGNLYVADTGNHRIVRITPQGVVSTVAGSGTAGFAGDNGPAAEAMLRSPSDVAIGADGTLYIADNGNGRVRMVRSGIISTVAAGLHVPVAVAIDAGGNLLVVAEADHQLRRIAAGAMTTVAGAAPRDGRAENISGASARLLVPSGIAIDELGNIYIADVRDKRIRKVDANGIISTVIAEGAPGFAGFPRTIAVDRGGNLYFSEDNFIRRFTAGGSLQTLAVLPPGSRPEAMVADAAGNLFLADSGNNCVLRLDTVSRRIAIVAGTGKAGYEGDRGPATAATLSHPGQLALDVGGNLYIADTNNNRIRRVARDGTITTVAGNGIFGDAGDGGDPVAAQLSQPSGVAVDAAGNLYIGCQSGARIRRVAAGSNIIETIAGTGTAGFSGDGGPATSARVDSPALLAVDSLRNVYFVDAKNQRLRKLTPGTRR